MRLPCPTFPARVSGFTGTLRAAIVNLARACRAEGEGFIPPNHDSDEPAALSLRWTRVWVLLATGGGLGYSPVASGTFGTLPGLLIVAATWHLGLTVQIVACIILAVAAVPLCEIAEDYFGKKDDGRIVADEFMTFPISMVGLPLHPLVLALAFLTNRIFDILKPPPARELQALHGGFGIVIDDVFAAFYSLVANHLVYGWLVAHKIV